MTSAFCPGHITCFFRPEGLEGRNPLAKGSIGVGVRLSRGATASVTLTDAYGIHVYIDGVLCDAPVTRRVVQMILSGYSAEVRIENDLPMGEGFGMSAAGAVATAMCCADLCGDGMPAVYRAAHWADIAGGGGLGDVSAISSDFHVPIRHEPGLPPYGRVDSVSLRFDELTLAVLGPKMNTGETLGKKENFDRIISAGDEAMREFVERRTKSNLFAVSNRFSHRAGVESPEVSEAIGSLASAGIPSAMCMLGNSIFAEASAEEVREVLGKVELFQCSSSDAPPRLSHALREG